MIHHPVFHQIIPVNRLLHLILPFKCLVEKNVATMSLPSRLCLHAPHATLSRLSSALATSPWEAKSSLQGLGPFLTRETRELLLSFQMPSERARLPPLPKSNLQAATLVSFPLMIPEV